MVNGYTKGSCLLRHCQWIYREKIFFVLNLYTFLITRIIFQSTNLIDAFFLATHYHKFDRINLIEQIWYNKSPVFSSTPAKLQSKWNKICPCSLNIYIYYFGLFLFRECSVWFYDSVRESQHLIWLLKQQKIKKIRLCINETHPSLCK